MNATVSPADALAPPDNDLLTEILARRRRRLPKATIALAALLVLALSFVVGAEVQKHYGKASAAAAGPAAAFARGGAARAGGFPGFGAGGAGGGTAAGGAFGARASGPTGTVTLIKGSTLYVTDSSGNTTLVKTSPTSRVTKSVASSVKNIRPGAVVTVTGPQASDGSYTASSISVSNGVNGG
jgi:hypothetical protein